MKAIEEINTVLRAAGGFGLFHDTRSDVRVLAQACQELIEKVNELVKEVNTLKAEKLNADSGK